MLALDPVQPSLRRTWGAAGEVGQAGARAVDAAVYALQQRAQPHLGAAAVGACDAEGQQKEVGSNALYPKLLFP